MSISVSIKDSAPVQTEICSRSHCLCTLRGLTTPPEHTADVTSGLDLSGNGLFCTLTRFIEDTPTLQVFNLPTENPLSW